MADALRASLDANLGSLYLGNFAAGVLYGITSLQTFIFFKGNNNDRRAFKAVIFLLWILDTIHAAFMATIVITCLSDIVVRIVFAHRIWRLSQKKKIYPLIIFFLSLTSLVGGFVCAVQMFTLASLILLPTVADSFFVGMSSGVAADLAIALSMVYLLVKSQTGFKQQVPDLLKTTERPINFRACRLMALITYALWTEKYIFFGIYYVLPELSLNALLATLNARESLRDRMYGVTTIPLELAVGTNQASSSGDHIQGHADQQSLAVQIDKHTVTIDDS
ncbi:hypothetical protein ONZ45_g14403 [Pleurotus djamor]|nr:hypothetical protein ONZ45_g14403 [Pleurotus djamor]